MYQCNEDEVSSKIINRHFTSKQREAVNWLPLFVYMLGCICCLKDLDIEKIEFVMSNQFLYMVYKHIICLLTLFFLWKPNFRCSVDYLFLYICYFWMLSLKKYSFFGFQGWMHFFPLWEYINWKSHRIFLWKIYIPTFFPHFFLPNCSILFWKQNIANLRRCLEIIYFRDGHKKKYFIGL